MRHLSVANDKVRALVDDRPCIRQHICFRTWTDFTSNCTSVDAEGSAHLPRLITSAGRTYWFTCFFQISATHTGYHGFTRMGLYERGRIELLRHNQGRPTRPKNEHSTYLQADISARSARAIFIELLFRGMWH